MFLVVCAANARTLLDVIKKWISLHCILYYYFFPPFFSSCVYFLLSLSHVISILPTFFLVYAQFYFSLPSLSFVTVTHNVFCVMQSHCLQTHFKPINEGRCHLATKYFFSSYCSKQRLVVNNVQQRLFSIF